MTKTAVGTVGNQWVLKLPYTSPPLSLNRQMHHMKEHRERQQILSDVGWLARAGKLPKGLASIHVTLVWRPKQIRRRDSDNPTPTIKACIDALVRHGMVPDDTASQVSHSAQIAEGGGPSPHGMWLVITECDSPFRPVIDPAVLR